MSKPILYNKSCYGLEDLEDDSIDALVTDPPYGLGFQNHDWDKGHVPKKEIWENTLRVLKPGGYGVVFSFPRLMHRVMIDIEDSGFLLKDVLFWANLNGMPKTRNIALDIDKELGIESEIDGEYNYTQGYVKDGADSYKVKERKYRRKPTSELGKKYAGSGTNLKPVYEPIILIQKPISEPNIAKNVIKYGTGVLNIEEGRIPYSLQERGKKIGHNPHPIGRVPSHILRYEEMNDKYDKFFVIPKVRKQKDLFNYHPTIKPIELMSHLISLVSFKDQLVLDPFMGSGSTALAAIIKERNFIGYEKDKKYFDISKKRIDIELNQKLI